MNSNKVASALKRQKELLDQVFDLAECQLELLETDRVNDLEVLLSLRGGLLSELAVSDEEIDPEMSQIRNDRTVTTEQLDELHALNHAILQLADHIAILDEEAEWLAECNQKLPIYFPHEGTPASETAYGRISSD
jgi:hypothetical protein